MSVKKNPLFSLFELNEFKEEKYNLKPLSEEARQNIANEFFKSRNIHISFCSWGFFANAIARVKATIIPFNLS